MIPPPGPQRDPSSTRNELVGIPPPSRFRPHPIVWTPERVARFWDWWGSRPRLERSYFTAVLGEALLREVRRMLPRSGIAVDYGADGGHLTELLLNEGYAVVAVDHSTASVALLRAR